MVDQIAAWLALPNLHPAVVHFPVALLLTALGFDVACLVVRRWPWVDRAATSLYVLGTAGAGAAYLSGDAAADGMWAVAGEAQAVLADHENGALLTLGAFAVVAVLRWMVSWLGRRDRRIQVGFFRLVALVAAAAAAVLLVQTARLGGELVYTHGLGVTAAPAAAVSPDLDPEYLEP